MRVLKCANGHFYDGDKFSVCPRCNEEGNSLISRVPPSSNDDGEGKTVSYVEAVDEEKTQAYDWNLENSADQSTSTENGDIDVSAEPKERFEPVVGWLVCLEGPERGRDYRLLAGRNYIGRSIDMEISIPDDKHISRDRHCSVIYDPRSYGFFVIPGDSALTTVNGETVTMPKQLKDGDIVACGESKLCFIAFCKEGRDWEQ